MAHFTRFFLRTTFRKEMTAVITLKMIALIIIWGLFFSAPVKNAIKKDTEKLKQHFISDTF